MERFSGPAQVLEASEDSEGGHDPVVSEAILIPSAERPSQYRTLHAYKLYPRSPAVDPGLPLIICVELFVSQLRSLPAPR